MSDTRLNSIKQKSAVHDVEKNFFFKGYKLIHNSTLPSRGVGILINKKYDDTNFSILREISTADCNCIALHVKIFKKEYFLVSLCGPNLENEIAFYDELSTVIRNFNCPLIIGGDWNATLHASGVSHNLDVVNMRSIPSHTYKD